jgi:AmmeMemoRadiSam system protein A
MARLALPETRTLSAEDRDELLAVAWDSIRHGLRFGSALSVEANDFTAALRQQRATFVTLHKQQQLRGCIGTLEAYRPLVTDVAANAWAAGFRDPRFAPLTEAELALCTLSISVLSPSEPLAVTSEADLLTKLRPGIDGLILQDGRHRATFLPAVWESLPEPNVFVRQLKLKAGLNAHHWSDSIQVERYTTESFD